MSLDEEDHINWLPERESKSEEASNAEDEINSTADRYVFFACVHY